MNPVQKAIIKTLLYFDIFGHPLNKTELYEFLSVTVSKEEFNVDMEKLLSDHMIESESGYYYVNLKEINIQERIKNLKRSEKYKKIAAFVSRIIFMHPFVRGVFISGSLSKSAISHKDDIDFFVITVPGRLWICRTSLMFFKKIFLFNSKKYFCINYFIDTTNLVIPEKNIFTATELAFIRPVQNNSLYTEFIDANNWIRDFFPNKNFKNERYIKKNEPLLKKIAESLLKGHAGERLDNYFLHIYRIRWKKKFNNIDKDSFDLNFRSEKNVSKHHPKGFQQKVLKEYENKIRDFGQKYKIELNIDEFQTINS